jgi:hypothetical protein
MNVYIEPCHQQYSPLVFNGSSLVRDWGEDGTSVQRAVASKFEFFTSNREAVG